MLPKSLSLLGLQRNVCQTVIFVCKHNLKCSYDVRHIRTSSPQLVQKILGIETSCDDTGCAVVDTNGNLLGDALKSQLAFHNANGGVIPPLAANLHKKHIADVVDNALSKAGVKMEDIDAIATTVKPGLKESLEVGATFGSHLAKKYGKPYIPIHHMEAHALAVRMTRKDVEFPYLTLLISGGHTLLAIARSVDQFELLGDSEGIAIGDILDKVARRLKLLNYQEYRNLSGGRAIEIAASKATDLNQYQFPIFFMKEKSCDFRLSGLSSHCQRLIESTEIEHGVEADATIPGVENFCAGVQLCVAHYVSLRVQYAMMVIKQLQLIKEPNPFLVVSGGVACNQFFQKSFEKVCNIMDFRLAVPPPKLCTDNGVMIAWNGVEKLLANRGVIPSEEAKNIGVEPTCPLGINITQTVKEFKYPCEFISAEELLGRSRQKKFSQRESN